MKVLELKQQVDTKTLHLFLLNIATCGVYLILWMYINNERIEKVLGKQLFDKRIIIILASLSGWALYFTPPLVPFTITMIISISASAIYITWAFKAKSILQETMLNEYRIDYQMNPFYTFIFNAYYICFCINELDSEVEKKKFISEKSAA